MENYFDPTEIKANIILDANPVTGTCGKKIGVTQKFSITFNSNQNGAYQKKSGNPGYLDGLPVKLAEYGPNGDQSPRVSYLDGH